LSAVIKANWHGISEGMALAKWIECTFNSKQTSDNKGARAMADVKHQAEGKIEEGTNWSKKTVDAAVNKGGEVSSSVRDHVKHAVDTAQEGYQEVAESGQEIFRQADAALRDNPHLSVGAALGAGVLVGMLVGLALGSARS
jgi:ElaB/YqjD/DUF883 family membrane-anchored ribosome-binding protein